MTVTVALEALLKRKSLTRTETRELFGQLMRGEISPAQTAALLIALRCKGESMEEIAGAAEAMRASAVPVSAPGGVVVDTCGTGGDGLGTFNISTAAAFVVAGAGCIVAKHGNRSISSRCGSADVLEACGIPPQADAATVERCLAHVGIAFLFAPSFHPAMKHAMPVRRELAIRTLFNLLGPLTNPARPTVQIVGVYEAGRVKSVAQALAALGCKEGAVVHGLGQDEIALEGPTDVAEIVGGKVTLRRWTPEHFGIKTRRKADVRGGDAAESAALLRGVLSGTARNDLRDAVCINAAAAIRAAFRAGRPRRSIMLREGLHLAYESIDSGRALSKLEGLRNALSSGKAA